MDFIPPIAAWPPAVAPVRETRATPRSADERKRREERRERERRREPDDGDEDADRHIDVSA
jgi:hypothetical protein